MASLGEVRQAIADALNTIDGLRATATLEQVQAPMAVVEPDRVDWRTAFQRGHDTWTILVRILIGTAANRAAEIARNEFFDAGGPKDVKDAIEGHVPLRDGTVAQDVFVAEARKFDTWEFSGVAYLGVEVVVDVYA